MSEKKAIRKGLVVLALFATLLVAGCGGGGGGGGGSSEGGGQSQASTHAYRRQPNQSKLVVYGWTAGDGMLAARGSVATSNVTRNLAVRPDGRFLYLSNGGSVSAYRIDAASGGLSYLADADTNDDLGSVLMDGPGRFLFRVNANSTVTTFRIGADDGILSLVGDSPVTATRLAADPAGRFLYATTPDKLVTYEIAADGTLAPVSETPVSGANVSFDTVAADPKGQFVFATIVDRQFGPGRHDFVAAFELDGATGALTNVDTVPTGRFPIAIAPAPDGGAIYVTSNDDNQVSAYRVDRSTGTLASAGSASGGGAPGELSLDPGGNFLYVDTGGGGAPGSGVLWADALATYAIDPATRSLTPLRTEQTLDFVGPPTFAGASQ